MRVVQKSSRGLRVAARSRVSVIVNAVRALGVLALQDRVGAALSPEQRDVAHDALVDALEVLNDEAYRA